MFDYLQKYNQLPKELRDKINAPAIVVNIDKIEKKYSLSVASLIMKVMVKEIAVTRLKEYFLVENKFSREKAENIVKDLVENVFIVVKDHLGISVNRALSAERKIAETHVVKYENHLPVKQENKSGVPALGRKASPPRADLPLTEHEEEKKDRTPIPVVKDSEAPVKPAHSFDAQAGAEKVSTERRANFFFSPEDEEDVRRIIKKAPVISLTTDMTEDKLEKIISAVEINFGSEFLVDRFKQILRTYIKGIRNSLDTKITLKKSFETGGLSFDDDSASQVLAIADKLSQDNSTPVSQPKKITVPEDLGLGSKTNNSAETLKIGLRDVGYDFSSLIKKEEKREEKSEDKKEEEKSKSEPAKEAASIEKKEIKDERDQAVKISVRAPVEASGKVKMEDIKFVPLDPRNKEARTMTPIDELRAIDLVIFRRMGRQDALRTTAKIKEMINLLEAESYNKKMEAVKAWRLSPINTLYLEIGEKSISENRPVDVIIAERKVAGKECLTNAEFEAIMDLNRELRF